MVSAKYTYFSNDNEATGPTAGKYSIMSIGSCVAFHHEINFYRELKPISPLYVRESMEVGCLGLKCLEGRKTDKRCDPKNKRFFDPEFVLKILDMEGERPENVMHDFAKWIKKNSRGTTPREVAGPIKFDGGLNAWYFDNYNKGENPFGHGGEDIGSLIRGYFKRMNARAEDLPIKDTRVQPHNALEDAIYQSKQFEFILDKFLLDRLNK